MSDGPGPREGPSDRESREIEVFATGTTFTISPDHPSDDGAPGLSDHVRRGGAAVRTGYEHARDFHARPGHRPGIQISATSSRRGGDTDIVRPVLVNPLTASEFAVSGLLFTAPIPHLVVDHHDHDPDEAQYLVWTATVETERGRRIPAMLHLLASPSMVVTVLELVPCRRLRWGGDEFVRAGVDALDALARRLAQVTPGLVA